jgi:hypothetical protein
MTSKAPVKVRPPKSKSRSTDLRRQPDDLELSLEKTRKELEEWADAALTPKKPPGKTTTKVPAKPVKSAPAKAAAKPAGPVKLKAADAPVEKEIASPLKLLRANAPYSQSAPVLSGKKQPPPLVLKSVNKGKKAMPLAEPLVVGASRLLQTTLQAARLEYCDNGIGAAGEVDNLVLGIPIPFAMEYLLQNSVFPLSRMIQLVGQEKSNKSSLTFEFARWFHLASGVNYLFENEHKYSTDLAQSIFGYADEIGVEVLGHHPCKSLQDWQQRMTFTMQQLRYAMTGIAPNKVKAGFKDKGKKKKSSGDEPKKKDEKFVPLGRIYPILFILDSIAGSIDEEKSGKIDTAGFAERNFATEAMHNATYLKKICSDFVNYPISLVVVNHLKKQKAENGSYIERIKPGGKLLNFQETFEIEMSKKEDLHYVDSRPDSPSLDINGNRLKLQVMRSSLGEEDRQIEVDFMWWNDWSQSQVLDEQIVRQYSAWKWSAATVDLLCKFEGERRAKLFNNVVDVRKIKDNEFWSKRLGIPQTNPISKDEMGTLIESTPEITSGLRDLLSIKQRTIFHAGTDYKQAVSMQARKHELKMLL